MITVKVTFDNGNSITTRFNGTEAEAREYYAIGTTFNIGDGEFDLMAAVTNVKLL